METQVKQSQFEQTIQLNAKNAGSIVVVVVVVIIFVVAVVVVLIVAITETM